MVLNCALDLLAVSWRSERLREEQGRLGGVGRAGRAARRSDRTPEAARRARVSARWDRAAAAVAVVLGLLLVVGASSRRPWTAVLAAPALPTWPLLFVVGVGLVMSAALGSRSSCRRSCGCAPDHPARQRPARRAADAGALAARPRRRHRPLRDPAPSGPRATLAPPPRPPPTTRSRANRASPAPTTRKGSPPSPPASPRRRGPRGGRARAGAPAPGARDRCRGPRSPRARATPPRPPPSRPTRAPPCWQPMRAWRRRSRPSGSPGAPATPRASTSRAWRPGSAAGARPPTRLTELFERARFSPHPVGEDLRARGDRRPGDAPHASSRRRRERGAHRPRRPHRRRRRARTEPRRCRRCAAPRRAPPLHSRRGRPATASAWTASSARRRPTPATCTCACARSCARSPPTGCAAAASSSTRSPRPRRQLLAPDTWEVVRPDRPRPDDAFAPGLAPARLDAVLDDLEALLR